MYDRGITNIEGLQHCTNLTYLDLSNNNINDIIKLTNLKSLNFLNLNNCGITNIEDIEQLNNLESLHLSNNNINNIDNIIKLTNLKSLNLNNCGITNIEDIEQLTNLESLDLSNNNINDINNIIELINLKGLYLENCGITSIDGIEQLINLESLNLSNNKINNIDNIIKLTNLKQLYLKNCSITNIEGIEQLNNLVVLILSFNNIDNIDNIIKLTNLERLSLRKCGITNVEGIENLKNLESIDLSGNKINNIDNIIKLTKLKRISLENCSITNIEGIEKLKNLEELYLNKSKINNINNIIGLENLRILFLSDCGLTNIDGIENLNKLDLLWLDNNRITDISPLVNLKNLSSVRLSNNNLDLSENSEAMKVINTLKQRGTDVYYDNQNNPQTPVSNELPQIIANDVVIQVGENFNPLENVSACDKEDGDLTSKIKFDGYVDTTKTGNYEITYSVLDSKNAVTTKTITVTVIDKINIEGIYPVEGNGTSLSPLVLSIDKVEAVSKFVNSLQNKFVYNVLETTIKEDYKIYKIKLNKKQRVALNDYYIELKVNLKDQDIINKLESVFDNSSNNDSSTVGGGVIYPPFNGSNNNSQTPPSNNNNNTDKDEKPPVVEVVKFNDIKNHWAEKTIELFAQQGFISGYGDDTFKPNNSMTRAEFVKLVNKVFGFTEKGTEKFDDVDENNWFYSDVCIGIKAGYIKGKSENTFAPNENITRQEVAMILTNIMNNKDENIEKLNSFKDGNKTSSWAKSSVEGAIKAGYLKGYEDNTIRSKGNITRAEVISVLSRIK